MAEAGKLNPSEKFLADLASFTGMELSPAELAGIRSVVDAHVRRLEILRTLHVEDDVEQDNTWVREGE